MRKIILTVSLLVGTLSLFAQGLPLREGNSFKEGERVTMGIMYKWGAVNTEVAVASLKLESVLYQADTVYHATCTVQSVSFFDVVYRMREKFQSWFAQDDYRPLEAIRDTYEGGYTAKNHFIYDWDAVMIRAEVAYNDLPPEKKEIPMTGASYDIVSLIYHLRNVDWESTKGGKSYEVPFAIDDEVYNLSVTYHGPERFKVRKLGKRDALHFSCTVVAGALFEGDQQIQVWFSADEKRIPLAVMVPLKMGTMWAWLKGVEGVQ